MAGGQSLEYSQLGNSQNSPHCSRRCTMLHPPSATVAQSHQPVVRGGGGGGGRRIKGSDSQRLCHVIIASTNHLAPLRTVDHPTHTHTPLVGFPHLFLA